MTLIQMLYYKTVCQTLSFTKAANILNISQPAISGAIRSIEDECHISLFNRDGNTISLTEEGLVLLGEIELVLKQYDELTYVINNLSLQRKFIRIGFSTFSGNEVYPELLAGFKEKHPEIEVSCIEASTPSQFEMLDAGKLDIIITKRDFKANNISKEIIDLYGILPTKMSTLFFCVGSNSKFVQILEEPVSIGQVGNIPLVLLTENFSMTRSIMKTFSAGGITPKVIHHTSQMYTLERFIERNVAGGFLPASIVNTNSLIKGYKTDFIREDPTTLIWRKDRYMFAPVKWFIETANEMFNSNKPLNFKF